MSTKKTWQQWEGLGFSPSNYAASVYYYPGKVDIESNTDLFDALVEEIHMDGVAVNKSEARKFLESAIVVHGQVVEIDGELQCYFGPDHSFGEEGYTLTHEATWVELDEDAE